MPRKVKIAVIGTGRMGSVHTRNIVRLIPEAELVAVCDIRLDVAQAVADELGIRRVVKDYHDLLEDRDIEAILIASSTDTHAFMMKDGAEAGNHIFCEKPLALELDKIDEALAAVDKAGVKLQVGFNRRFDKSFQRVREIVASGEIGRPCTSTVSSFFFRSLLFFLLLFLLQLDLLLAPQFLLFFLLVLQLELLLTPQSLLHAEHLREKVSAARGTVIALFSKISASKGRSGMAESLRDTGLAITKAATSAGRPVIVVSFDSPYILDQFTGADALIAAYDRMDEIQQAVAEMVGGG